LAGLAASTIATRPALCSLPWRRSSRAAAWGPEAPLADACGSLGTWTSDQLKLDERQTSSLGFAGLSGELAAFLTSPFGGAVLSLESVRAGISYPWMLFPSLVSLAFAAVIFVMLSGSFFGALYAFPDYHPRLIDLLLAVPLGLVGSLAGGLFIVLFKRLRQLMRPLKSHLIVRGLIGGLGLRIAGALLPLTLFSGEVETAELINRAAEIGVVMLIVLALVKLLITTIIPGDRLAGRLYLPDDVCRYGAGHGSSSHLSDHTGSSGSSRHDGRHDGRHYESADLLGVVCHGVGAGRGLARDRYRRDRRRISDRAHVDGVCIR
jgi:hypothetical protein